MFCKTSSIYYLFLDIFINQTSISYAYIQPYQNMLWSILNIIIFVCFVFLYYFRLLESRTYCVIIAINRCAIRNIYKNLMWMSQLKSRSIIKKKYHLVAMFQWFTLRLCFFTISVVKNVKTVKNGWLLCLSTDTNKMN